MTEKNISVNLVGGSTPKGAHYNMLQNTEKH